MLEIDGIKFRSGADYQAGLKDKATIEKLKEEFDINTRAGVTGIYRELQFIDLESELGRRFDDEIYELYTKYKNGELIDQTEVKSSRKKADKKIKAGHTLPEGDVKASKKAGPAKVRSKKEQSSLEPLDPELQREVDRIIRRSNRRRTILIVVMGLISVGCLSYFGNYMIKASQAEANAKELAALRTAQQLRLYPSSRFLRRITTIRWSFPRSLTNIKSFITRTRAL